MFDFGLRIRELRESRNMSQEALGRRVGRSKPVISSYENNIKLPPLDVLIDMSNVFNVSLDYLVGKEKVRTLNTIGLTPSQIETLRMIIDEFNEQNTTNTDLTNRQIKILNVLLLSFFQGCYSILISHLFLFILFSEYLIHTNKNSAAK